MPEIPQSYGPTVRREALPAPLANPRMASPDAFGASVAEGLQRGADIAFRAKQQADDDRDTVESLDAFNQFLEEDHAKMTEFRQRTGGKAKDLLTEAETDYQKRQNDHAAKLTNPKAREKFLQMTGNRWSNRNSAILGEHQADQMRAYTLQTMDSTVKNAHLDALDDGSDEALERADTIAAITRKRMADTTGTDAQTLDLAMRADREALFSAAIEQDIMGDNWKGAKARLDKYGESALSDSKRTQLAAKIKEGGLNQQAQDTADTIFKSGFAVTKADADRMVSVEKDADLRQRIHIKVDQEWSRREEALKIARGKTYAEIAKAADNGEDPEALILKHENSAALTQEDKDHLRGIAARRAKRQEPQSGSRDYYHLRTAASMMPEKFVAEDLDLWRGRIPESERQGLIELQADMLGRKPTGGKDRKPSSLLTVSDIASRSLRKMGISGAIEKGERDPRADEFERQFDLAIQAEGGTQNLTNAQMEAIANRLMAEETRTVAAGGVGKFINMVGLGGPGLLGIGIDGTEQVRAFEQPGAQQRAFTISQVPESFLREASTVKDRNGNPPTEQMILNAYNASLGQ